MRLSAKSITSFSDINHYRFGSEWVVRSGDTNKLYFQLVDLDQESIRYVTGIGVDNQPASIDVTFPSIDDTAVIAIAAVVESGDASIWSITVPSTADISSGAVKFALTEGSNIRRFSVLSLISVEDPLNDGSC